MTDKNNTFGEAIAPLLLAGYPVSDLLPIIPPGARLDPQSRVAPSNCGKIPGRYAQGRDLETGQGTWGGLRGWENGLPEKDQKSARDWPTGNVGIRAEQFPGIDVDVNSEDARELVMGIVESVLSASGPVRTRAGAPRCLLPFRLAGEPFGKLRLTFADSNGTEHAVEILARGQQYVIAGRHPTGADYEWNNGGLAKCPPANLPSMTKDDADAFISHLGDEIAARGWKVTANLSGTHSGSGERVPLNNIEPPHSPEMAIAALKRMRNTEKNFPNRDDLVRVTAELKAALGPHAENHRADYLAWAEDGDFPDCDFESIWDSISEVRKDPLALYRRAHSHGFVGDAVIDFDGAAPTTPSAAHIAPRVGDSGKRPTNLATIAQKLAEAPEWQGVFGYDEFAQCETVLRHLPDPERPNYRANEPFTPRALLDSDVTQARLWLQRHGGMPSAKSSDVQDAIGWRARCSAFHPVRDWLGGLQWDGTPRLHSWLADYLGATADVPPELEELYLKEVGIRFMIGAVARIYEPGCKLDNVLVLEGEQGVGKSSVVRALVPNGDWHSETPPELGTRDAALHLQGKWVIELSELASVNRASQEQVKSFVTAPVDKFRRPYGRKDESFPRQCVFIGTTNADEFLRDDTGGRRFLPVRMTKPLDREAFLAVRDQLWAEAKAAYQKGEPWHLKGEALDASKVAQAAKAETDPWDAKVVASAWELARKGHTPPTATAILEEGLGIRLGNQEKRDQMRVGGSLARAGWVRKQQRINGAPVKFWWHPELGDPPLATWNEVQRLAASPPGHSADEGAAAWSG